MGCRQEAEQAREQLQARVTGWGGRVRCLEAGDEMQPPQQQQQMLLQQQRQPVVSLPWAAASRLPSGSGRNTALPAAFQQAPWQVGQQQAPANGHSRSNPLYDQTQQAGAFGSAMACLPTDGVATLPQHASAVGPAMHQRQPERQPLPPAPVQCCASGSYGSTSELISGMQARFSEAEGFLSSLQRP